jgi:hypothetical protein
MDQKIRKEKGKVAKHKTRQDKWIRKREQDMNKTTARQGAKMKGSNRERHGPKHDIRTRPQGKAQGRRTNDVRDTSR